MIQEVIVVEGKSDISAVSQAVEAEILSTNGFSLDRRAVDRVRAARRRVGVILLMDPDTAGEQIRRRLVAAVGPCKHARIPRADCTRADGNIGVENASPEAIRTAIAAARPEELTPRRCFKNIDLVRHGLNGTKDASARRSKLGTLLGIGDTNARQLLRRLNHYGVTREEFAVAVAALDDATCG
ncbi:MAG: ribonuclease M5 [Myxococcota bacterium]|jgi:ribonuclease M5